MQISRRLCAGTLNLGQPQARLDRSHHAFSESILQIEDVIEASLEPVCPYVCPGFRRDQLAGDAHAVSGPAYAPLEYVAHTQLASDLFDVNGLALVRKTRIAGDYEEGSHSRERGNNVVNYAISEVLLRGVAAQIDEGQHRDRRFIGVNFSERLQRRESLE